MCRMLAYLGPPRTLEALLLAPEHSLLRQSWAPRHQTDGVVNADGFGAGWYAPAVRPEPALYRSTRPIWADRSFASLAGVVSSGAVLAAVRDATPGFPVEESATPPFTSGRFLFAHNGLVEGWREGAGEALRARLSPARASALGSTVDSEVLFALALEAIEAGAEPGEALARVVSTVKEVSGGRLTMVLTDGRGAWATAFGASLFARPREGVVIASEPADDGPGWEPVPDVSLVRAGADGVAVTPL